MQQFPLIDSRFTIMDAWLERAAGHFGEEDPRGVEELRGDLAQDVEVDTHHWQLLSVWVDRDWY